MRRFDTASAMVAATLQAGLVVETRQYSTGAGGAAYDILTLSQFVAATGSAPDEIGDLTVANGTVAKLRKIIVNVTEYGALGDGSTDDTASIQAALDAGINNEVFFPAGTYSTTIASDVSTGTTVKGIYGQSIMRPSATYTGLATGSDGAIFRNKNFFATELTDENIVVEDINFEWSLRDPVPNAQAVSTFMRYVTNVKTLNCTQSGGENMTGFLKCSHTWIEGNFCAENKNAAYDQWSSTGHIIVSNNINHSVTQAPNQCIQLTGNDTDPVTTLVIPGGFVTKAIIEGNIIDVPEEAFNSGIILNNLSATSLVQNCSVANNYVQGPRFGIVMEGGTNNTNITNNTIKDCLEHGLLIFDGAEGVDPSNWKVEGNMFNDCATESLVIDVRNADLGTIRDNTINGGGFNVGIQIRVGATNIRVADNRVPEGLVADIVNSSSSCDVSKPDGVQWRALAKEFKLIDGVVPPTTFTTVDISSVVGTKRVLVYAKLNNAVSAPAVSPLVTVFMADDDGGGDDTNPIGHGPHVSQLQADEEGYVCFITDNTGKFKWRCDTVVTAGDVSLVLRGFVEVVENLN